MGWKGRVLIVVILLALAGGGGYLWLNLSGQRELDEAIAETERTDPDWRLARVLAGRSVVPDDENSALVLLRAARLGVVSWSDEVEKVFEHYPAQARLNDQQLGMLRQILQGKDAAIQEARKLKDLPRGRFDLKYSEDYISTIMEPIQSARGVFTLLHWDSMRRAEAEDMVGALDSCRAMLNAARSVGEEPTLIAQLVRIAGLSMAISATERALAQGEAPPGKLRELQQLVELEMKEPLMAYGLRGERAGMFQVLQMVRDGKANAKGLGLNEGGFGMRGPGFYAREQAGLLRYMNKAVEASRLPPEEQTEAFNQLEIELRTMKAEGRNIMACLLAPACARVQQAHRRVLTQLRCMQAALAAERFHAQERRWPKTLEELVAAKLLPQVPRDLYSKAPVQLLHRADGITIYSVGEDGKDNGGEIRDNFRDEGSDMGFRLWNVSARRQAPRAPVILDPEP